MAKGKSQPVFISKKELLLPKMEFLPLNDAGQGFNIRELSGKAILEYKELINRIEKENKEADVKDLTELQSLELMTVLVFMGACNADGTPYFANMDEAYAFAGMSLTQLEKVSDKVMEVSGIGLGATQNLKNDQTVSSTTS